MFIDPESLSENLERLEGIEKGTIRLVSQALYIFRDDAASIFRKAEDLAGDIGEDITREALDRMGVSKIDERLFGKMDYKRARYIFNKEYAVRQAMFVDSKAEKNSGRRTATIQTSQTSMRIRLLRKGQAVDEVGKLRPVLDTSAGPCLTTTIFVKYNYEESAGKGQLIDMIVAAIPNGKLQERYNPNATTTIWRVGRDSPKRGEEFRVRLSFSDLKKKTTWRVQTIPVTGQFQWSE